MKKEVLFCIALVMLSSLATASYQIDRNFTTIDARYNADDKIKGKLNMSFSEQENEKFTSNFDGEISLYNLLVNMSYLSGRDFICNPASCVDDYSFSTGEETKKFRLSANNINFYGFVLNGNVTVNSFSLNITSDAEKNCKQQLNADLLADGQLDFFASNYFNENCGEKDYGCFMSNTKEAANADLTSSTLYCEKINLSVAPAYRVGAELSASVNVGEIEFSMYKETGGYAIASNVSNDPSAGSVSVILAPSPNPQKSFSALVCVRDKSNKNNYKIKFKESGCGGSFSGGKFLLDSDFEIFVQPLAYAPLSEIKIGNSSTSKLINDYLKKVYGGKCTEGCIIPIKISGIAQNITLHDGNIPYQTAAGISSSTQTLYDVSLKGFTITSNYAVLDIEKMNFIAPDINGTRVLEIYFAGDTIASKNIQILKGFDFSIGPLSVLLGQDTTFSAIGSKGIVYSEWNFGDGTGKIISNSNKATHAFFNESAFIVEVRARANDSTESTKKFSIVVGEPKKSANLTIVRYEKRIAELKKDLVVFPSWIKSAIETEVDILTMESSLKKIKDDFSLLGNNAQDSDYIAIINRLVNLNVPSSISIAESGTNLPMELGFSNIDSSYIKEISGSEEGNDEGIKKGILEWSGKNYQGNIDYQTISLGYEDKQEKLASTYKITLTKKPEADAGTAYLIVDYPTNSIKFKDSAVNVKSLSNGQGTSIEIVDGQPSTVEFLIIGEAPNSLNLGAYISPVLNEINIESEKPIWDKLVRKEGKFLWGRFLIGLAVIFILFILLYSLLYLWYKNRYEKHLFENPNDLYNLIYFIYNSRRSGIKDDEIKKKLREKKWTGEQVTYAFKKIDGRRTGMMEIPIFKFLENRHVRREIEKKEAGAPVDARFIKRPGLY